MSYDLSSALNDDKETVILLAKHNNYLQRKATLFVELKREKKNIIACLGNIQIYGKKLKNQHVYYNMHFLIISGIPSRFNCLINRS